MAHPILPRDFSIRCHVLPPRPSRRYAAGAYLYANPDVAAVLLAIFLLWLLQRHVRRQRYLQRVGAWFGRGADRLRAQYNRAIAWVARRSQWAAAFLPHVVFVMVLGVVLTRYPAAMSYASSAKALFSFAVMLPVVVRAATPAATAMTPQPHPTNPHPLRSPPISCPPTPTPARAQPRQSHPPSPPTPIPTTHTTTTTRVRP